MIGYIEGKILKKEDERVLVLANQVGYEILLPAFVMEGLATQKVGDDIALYIFYQQTERQPKPILIGFNLEAEKEFFQFFISVEDIGPLKAVKALGVPVREVARAIENRDVHSLTQLKGIGREPPIRSLRPWKARWANSRSSAKPINRKSRSWRTSQSRFYRSLSISSVTGLPTPGV